MSDTSAPPKTVLVGTSGYSYQDWIGPFYPSGIKQSEMLAFYARHFDAVELNFSYYAIPKAANLAAMVQAAGSKLKFSIKAHKSITHESSVATNAMQQFKDALQPLREAQQLAAILLQFPWGFKNGAASWKQLSQIFVFFSGYPLVVEFRNRSWVTEDTFRRLRAEQVAFCCVDEPQLPGLMPSTTRLTSSIGYVRFHGRNATSWWNHQESFERYNYLYSESELGEWIPTLLAMEKAAQTVLVFTNNHYLGQAVKNADMLIELLEKARTK